MRYFILSFLLSLSTFSWANEQSPFMDFNWQRLAEIPPAQGQFVQPGLAGAFTGVHREVLIIAGGANFPNGMVWEGGEKVYHDAIYILEKKGSKNYQWLAEKQFKLPEKIAYGLSIPTDKGIICIGGMNGSKVMNTVFFLKWNPEKKEIETEHLPPLPLATANMSGGKIGSKIFIAAGNKKKYFGQLDLDNLDEGWQELPVWEGSSRTHSVGVVQNNGETDCFYLFKGRIKGNDTSSTMHTDGFVYNPLKRQWKKIKSKTEFPLAAGTGIVLGANHILLFGGDDGKVFNQLEKLGAAIDSAADTSRRKHFIEQRDSLLINHQGFSKTIWAFHTITQTWSKVGTLPHKTQVTTTALKWKDRILIPSGEIAPSVRTPEIWSLSLSNKTEFGTINYLVLLVYLLVLVIIGYLFSKKQHSTHDFFKGGNRIPWWAAGLSIFGTQLSAITFMAIPAKTFATDWLYFFLMMTIIMVYPFIIRFFLPFYRRFNLTTAYEYLGLRFNRPTRLLGSLMYIFLQLGRLGIVLLLPSLALSVVTGIDVHICILTMGILSILYTVLGGIEAVIWTDVVQVIVLLGGALLSLVLLLYTLDGSDISTYVNDFQKMRIFDFEWRFSEPTLWVVLIGGFATNLIQYGSDQTVVQRYLTTKDEKSAANSIKVGAWLTLPATLIFFSLGTLLFVYYKTNPVLLNPVLDNTDTIFPWYIVNSLPEGVSGLLIAAIFAASMSSLDSSMNSVATAISTDFFQDKSSFKSGQNGLKVARTSTIIIGLAGTGLALMMATWGISSLWDQFNMIVGLFAGGLGGIFLLGIFSKRATGTGALMGLLLSGGLQYLIKSYTDIHLLMYAFTGMMASIAIGYLVSLFFAKPNEQQLRYTYSGLQND